MIKMLETKGPELQDPYSGADAYKEIKPVTGQTISETTTFWDKVFSEKPENTKPFWRDLTWDDIPALIYGVDEWDFDFVAPEDARITDILKSFYSDTWHDLSDPERVKLVKNLADLIGKDLGLTTIPEIDFVEKSQEDCGAFRADDGRIEINRNILSNPKELIDTLAHEMRHAYQWERSLNPETLEDFLYKCNFEEYISPVPVGEGKYLFVVDYMEQYIEAEARAYASSVSGLEVA